MKVGASYYPELIAPTEWEKDLATGRDLGLSCLRCGEFAWSRFAPTAEEWDTDWAVQFLELAVEYGYDVVWCTPSATPPPRYFDQWPELQAVDVEGRQMPVGIRRNYCPSHEPYLSEVAKIAGQLARDLSKCRAVVGWQIDNELAGDGFTCWCENCRGAFQQWLQARYTTLEALNRAWQTDLWSQRYTDWRQIPVPAKSFFAHAPALKLAYRRFKSDAWLRFYREQAKALHANRGNKVTTNFYNLTWDLPFNQWKWRDSMDAVGLSHYLEGDVESRFQLAVCRGAETIQKPLWVLEQKAGQQAAQNFYPDDLSRLSEHLVRCAQAGAEYAIYWHLRQHSAGCETEHGAVLRHDGKATRIGQAVAKAIAASREVTPIQRASESLLVFSFEQYWANEGRPQPGTKWDYRVRIEQDWYAGARAALGEISVGNWTNATTDRRMVLAPLAQLDEPGLIDSLRRCLDSGATVITTADLARLDSENNVYRRRVLASIETFAKVPEIEWLHLAQTKTIAGKIGQVEIAGSIFWAVPEAVASAAGSGAPEPIGELRDGELHGPVALKWRVGKGNLIVALINLNAIGVTALIRSLSL